MKKVLIASILAAIVLSLHPPIKQMAQQQKAITDKSVLQIEFEKMLSIKKDTNRKKETLKKIIKYLK